MTDYGSILSSIKGRPIAIGVDPGAKNTGIGIWDRGARRFAVLIKLPMTEALDFIKTAARYASHVHFRVEDPGLNKPIFSKRLAGKELQIALHTAQSVGMNKGIARFFIEELQRHRFMVEAVKPSTTKWDADEFRRFTKYTGRTNEHTRDAGRLVYDF